MSELIVKVEEFPLSVFSTEAVARDVMNDIEACGLFDTLNFRVRPSHSNRGSWTLVISVPPKADDHYRRLMQDAEIYSRGYRRGRIDGRIKRS